MASINQVISEIAHSVKQFDSVPVRRGVELAIYHNLSKLIRQSYERNGYTDRSLVQKFRVKLIDVKDGDLHLEDSSFIDEVIKRSEVKVPKPVRLTNNLPFSSIRTIGSKNSVSIPFVKEASSSFYNNLPGYPCLPRYDYINGYIYLTGIKFYYTELNNILVEAPFEIPTDILMETNENEFKLDKDDIFVIPEDMIYDLKKLVLDEMNSQVIRETSEIPNNVLTK